jgi:hypothetical protein
VYLRTRKRISKTMIQIRKRMKTLLIIKLNGMKPWKITEKRQTLRKSLNNKPNNTTNSKE